VLHAKVDHPANALNSQPSLCRTRLVVQPTVQNTTIMAGLMAAGTTFLLQKKQPSGREPLKKLARRRESDDSAANDSHCFAHLLLCTCIDN
jgi:hypothetical protein